MRRFLLWAAVALATAVAVHAALILAAPNFIMSKAMERVAGRQGVNSWTHGPRTTEASRAVVRPSPDLAYSACVYDLSNGPVRVTVAPWSGYYSVSIYAANSDNFFVLNDRTAPRGVDFLLVHEGNPAPAGPLRVVRSPSRKGIVLQRRLAPDAESFAAAEAARRGDRCEPVSAQR